MYLARKRVKEKVNYYIRESFSDGTGIKSRDICDLGSDPKQYVIYPDDGVSFYFDPDLIGKIEDSGIKPDTEELEKIFWPFLDPESRRLIEMFSRPSTGRKQSLKDQKKRCETEKFHLFDKRRMYYLRFGELDMRGLARVPHKIFRKLLDKSRDEIEQQFMQMEHVLEQREKKNYVYAIFGVADNFESEIARHFPQALDQEKVDRAFIQGLCHLNADESFWADSGVSQGLNDYLRRYAFWFFDTAFEGSMYLEDLMWQFKRRHHGFRPPVRKESMPVDEALLVMGLSGQKTETLTVRSMTQQYRIMAHKCHPDKGGDHDTFIRLNRAFRDLLKKIRR
jgi:hypothetical protein